MHTHLVAFESSGIVREALRRRGVDAVSCDLLPSEQDGPHILGDAVAALHSQRWELVVAHPPCTHLAASGARHWAAKRADGRQQEGVSLFLATAWACRVRARRWAIENPVGLMSRRFRRPDQIVQPWMFGHGETKATCWWTFGLPLLQPTDLVPGREARVYRLPPSPTRWRERSRTYFGMAAAIADQWA